MPRTASFCMKEIRDLHPDFCDQSTNYKGFLDACMADRPYTVLEGASGNCAQPPEGGRRRRKSNARKSRKSRSSKRSRKHRR